MKKKLNLSLTTQLTKPYTAFTDTTISVTEQSEKHDDIVQRMKKEKYPNITSLQPQSLQLMRRNISKELFVQDQKEQQEQPNLKFNLNSAEYIFENIDEFKKLDNNEYESFKKKYNKIVFDSKGNYLYTKIEPKSRENKNYLNGILDSKKVTSQSIEKSLKQTLRKFKPKKIINNMVKSAQNFSQIHPLKRALQDVKEKSLISLQKLLEKSKKEEIIENAKQELLQSANEMTNQVEKLIRENQVMKHELERLKDKNVELINHTENQTFKCEFQKKAIDVVSEDFDKLKKNSKILEQFIPEYKILRETFPDFINAAGLIKKYQQIEQVSIDLQIKIAKFEEERVEIDHVLNNQRQEFENKILELMQKDIMREKYIKKQQEQIQEKELEIKEGLSYKEKYMTLFQKLLNVFTQWNEKIKVYAIGQKKDNGPTAEVKDPIEMLSIMEKMIQISTSEKLQNYLRKIIVSANLLQRKYLPQFVNEKFDVDKIYERILKLVNKLNYENWRMQIENRELRRKVGISQKEEVLSQEQIDQAKKQSSFIMELDTQIQQQQ